jgi:hypothetical protein
VKTGSIEPLKKTEKYLNMTRQFLINIQNKLTN